ncbi:MAG TPA: enoyl-CoA hydratase/isomerase family protein [Burkholderiales bacterium]|nr:enoyl-CoA hydratase/isomerase family protein [Burkholderiales bacterium]
MKFTTLRYSVDAGVATLTLDRPEARNALNGAMCEDLRRAAMTAAADEKVRLVLVRGAGPVFCAGADLKERQGKTGDDIRARRIKGFAAYHALETLPMPAIAVVHGAALGSGVEIAACCDFIIATPDALFGTPEVLRGTVGATQRLPRVLGKRLAKDLMFTGRRLSAEEARAAGFVARVVEPANLEATLKEIQEVIVKASPHVMRYAKQCIDRGIELDPRGALGLELMAIEDQLASGTWLGKR